MIECAIKAAKEAGKILISGLGHNRNQLNIEKKGIGDYVTAVDKASEKKIIEIIKNTYPDHQIVAEESGFEKSESSYKWVIDPLDGTANYVHAIPVFAVSIALMENDEIILGVINVPEAGELFYAEKNRGAFLNGKKIYVSDQKHFSDSMIATGFPWRSRHLIDPYLKSFREILTLSAGVRRMGAAAVDLAYTACGRFEGFYELKLKPWDVAAGAVLIKEAGGLVTDLTGGQNFMSGNIAAGNAVAHKNIVDVTKKYLGNIS